MARPSARARILDCAEQLFADRGVAAVSLRAINAEAGLSPAALHYHFGDRESLVEALLARHMDTLMERRRQLLDLLEAGPTPTARGVMEALLRPMAELLAEGGAEGQRYVRFLARLQADGDLPERFVVERFRGGVERLEPLLRRALPDVPAGVVRLRLAFAIELVLRSLADWQALGGVLRSGQTAASLEVFVGALLDFLTGALEAPAGPAFAGTERTPETSAARAVATRGEQR